jgi:hypothetical protein
MSDAATANNGRSSVTIAEAGATSMCPHSARATVIIAMLRASNARMRGRVPTADRAYLSAGERTTAASKSPSRSNL